MKKFKVTYKAFGGTTALSCNVLALNERNAAYVVRKAHSSIKITSIKLID